MDEAREKRPFTAHNLVGAVDEFISDNRHSRDVELRWFASFLDAYTAPLAKRVRSGGLDEGERKLVSTFRLGEIEKEKAERQREIDRLDGEARKLSA